MSTDSNNLFNAIDNYFPFFAFQLFLSLNIGTLDKINNIFLNNINLSRFLINIPEVLQAFLYHGMSYLGQYFLPNPKAPGKTFCR